MLEKINPLMCIAHIFDSRYKLVSLELSLYNFFGQVQGSGTILKVKKKLKTLFDEH